MISASIGAILSVAGLALAFLLTIGFAHAVLAIRLRRGFRLRLSLKKKQPKR